MGTGLQECSLETDEKGRAQKGRIGSAIVGGKSEVIPHWVCKIYSVDVSFDCLDHEG